MTRRTLRIYGWLFALSGLVFVAGSRPFVGALDWALSGLPGTRALSGAEPSLWLGLTGALMAVIARAAFSLSRDPRREADWTPLLLSKAASSLLFVAFAWAEGNAGFLAGAAVDGAILAHLAWLRARVFAQDDLSLTPRAPGAPPPFYEAWFAKMNDPVTRSALWLRYTTERTDEGGKASIGYVLFDAPRGRCLSGRWDRPLPELLRGERTPFRLGDDFLEGGRISGAGEGAGWDLAWENGAAPDFAFAPPVLSAAGLLRSGYISAPSLARFTGAAWAGATRLELRAAPGSIGHLWGPRMPHDWRWAHAVFDAEGPSPVVFEILTARLRLGPWRSPGLSTAHLWFGGRHHRSVGLLDALRNSSWRDGDRWSFRVDFGELVARGECAPDPALCVSLPYRSPEGRELRCRNSKTGSMRLTLSSRRGEVLAALAAQDSAAVEFAGPA